MEIYEKKNSKLDKIPQEIGSVRKLNLNYNNIRRIENLETLDNLSELHLSHNQIAKICGLLKKGNLSYIDLSHNQILLIEGFKTLINLVHLNLSNNCIKKLENLSYNCNLVTLKLSHNAISHISNISSLTKLRELDLSNNKIKSLVNVPTHIPKGLTIFHLSNNALDDLTQINYLSYLPSLKDLSLAENPCLQYRDTRVLTKQKNFNHRPYVLSWCPKLKVLDNAAVTEVESLRAEWLYSQGRAHSFRIGGSDHTALVSYLLKHCPADSQDDIFTTDPIDDTKLKKILSHKKRLASSLISNNNLALQVNGVPSTKYASKSTQPSANTTIASSPDCPTPKTKTASKSFATQTQNTTSKMSKSYHHDNYGHKVKQTTPASDVSNRHHSQRHPAHVGQMGDDPRLVNNSQRSARQPEKSTATRYSAANYCSNNSMYSSSDRESSISNKYSTNSPQTSPQKERYVSTLVNPAIISRPQNPNDTITLQNNNKTIGSNQMFNSQYHHDLPTIQTHAAYLNSNNIQSPNAENFGSPQFNSSKNVKSIPIKVMNDSPNINHDRSFNNLGHATFGGGDQLEQNFMKTTQHRANQNVGQFIIPIMTEEEHARKFRSQIPVKKLSNHQTAHQHKMHPEKESNTVIYYQSSPEKHNPTHNVNHGQVSRKSADSLNTNILNTSLNTAHSPTNNAQMMSAMIAKSQEPLPQHSPNLKTHQENSTRDAHQSHQNLTPSNNNTNNFGSLSPNSTLKAATKIQAWWRGHLTRHDPTMLQKVQTLRMRRIEEHVCNIYDQMRLQREEKKIEIEMQETQLNMLKMMWQEIKSLKTDVDVIKNHLINIPVAVEPNSTQPNFSPGPNSPEKPVNDPNLPQTFITPNTLKPAYSPPSIKLNFKSDEKHNLSPETNENFVTTAQPVRRQDTPTINLTISNVGDESTLTTHEYLDALENHSLNLGMHNIPKSNEKSDNSAHHDMAEIGGDGMEQPDLLADLDTLENKVKDYEKLDPEERSFLLTNVSSTIMALQENLAKCLLNQAEQTSADLKANNAFIKEINGDGNDQKVEMPQNSNNNNENLKKPKTTTLEQDSTDIKLLTREPFRASAEDRTETHHAQNSIGQQLKPRGKTRSLDNAAILDKSLQEEANKGAEECPIKYPQIYEYLIKRAPNSANSRSESLDVSMDTNGAPSNNTPLSNKLETKTLNNKPIPNGNLNETPNEHLFLIDGVPENQGDEQEGEVVEAITENIVNSILLKAVKKYNDAKSHRSLSARANRFLDIDLTKL